MENRLYNFVLKYGFKYSLFYTLERLGIIEKDLQRSSLYLEHYFLQLSPQMREEELKKVFLRRVGYPLNLDSPKTLDEKLQWLKLYDSTPIKTKLSDKFSVREWVENKIGAQYLIPLLGVWNSFGEIDFDLLPNQFVLKATHGSETNIVVSDKDVFNKKDASKKFKYWMKLHFGVGPAQEWHYLNIPHKIVAEKYLDAPSGELADYKIFCFNGKPKYIQFILRRDSQVCQCFFDLSWNAMPFTNEHYARLTDLPSRPTQLNEIIRLSELLSEDLSFVRVDWYLVENRIFFGEMTFTPSKGFFHWIPQSADEDLGALLELPKEKYIFQIC